MDPVVTEAVKTKFAALAPLFDEGALDIACLAAALVADVPG